MVEPLTTDASFVSRPMFGAVGCYLRGRLVVVLSDRREPWRGLLIPTERVCHGSLIADFPELRVHTVLGKWLYLPQASARFADTASAVVEAIGSADPRIGVEPALRRLPRP